VKFRDFVHDVSDTDRHVSHLFIIIITIGIILPTHTLFWSQTHGNMSRNLLLYVACIFFFLNFQFGSNAHKIKQATPRGVGIMSRRLTSASRRSDLIPHDPVHSTHPSSSSSSSLTSILSCSSMFFVSSLTLLLLTQPALASSNLMISEMSIDDFAPPPMSTADAIASFVPPEVGSEIYVGSIVSLIPIVWASFELNSRIQTQRKCLLCKGSGLVKMTRSGSPLTRPRKCWLVFHLFIYITICIFIYYFL
jgi:hypothetical protein